MYQPIIGLEIHIEIKTKSKMFCRCNSDHFAKKPNQQTCPICLGLPGALPYANKNAIDKTVKLGLAFDCEINNISKFDRKHYFYPDLAKSYQISQYDLPFCFNGIYKSFDGDEIKISRIHLEEDTAKIIHQKEEGMSYLDFNRSGVPLLEMVTEPIFCESEERTLNLVIEFVKMVQLTVRYLDISKADMEKGSMRLEANISLTKKTGENALKKLPGYKVELKNINSFRFLLAAINAEIKRQRKILENGKIVIQETRGYNETSKTTFSQRSKEEAQDYRYFPEPDIPPVVIDEMYKKRLFKTIPELPFNKIKRYKKDYSLSDMYAWVLVSDQKLSEYFEDAIVLGKKHGINIKLIIDMIINKHLHQRYQQPAGLIKYIKTISLSVNTDYKLIESKVDEVIKNYPKAVDDYTKGKKEVLGFLIGMTQKYLSVKADPKIISELIKKKLD